jgi:hypothetical protein
MRSGHDVMCLVRISYTTFAALVASNLWEDICFGCSSLAVFGHHTLVDLHICVVFMVSVFSIHVDVCLAKIGYTTFAALVASNLWKGICFGCSSLAVFGHHTLVDLHICVVFTIHHCTPMGPTSRSVCCCDRVWQLIFGRESVSDFLFGLCSATTHHIGKTFACAHRETTYVMAQHMFRMLQ